MRHSKIKIGAFLFAIFLSIFAFPASAQKIGAYYLGDGDGNGDISAQGGSQK
jgi:hypothetical protein